MPIAGSTGAQKRYLKTLIQDCFDVLNVIGINMGFRPNLQY